MSLLGDLQNLDLFAKRTSLICTVCSMLAKLTDEERAALNAIMADPNVQGAAISRVLLSNGIDIKAGVLQRHRRKECAGGAAR